MLDDSSGLPLDRRLEGQTDPFGHFVLMYFIYWQIFTDVLAGETWASSNRLCERGTEK